MKTDKIAKLLFPLYEAEMECNEFENELEEEFGIEYEWDECHRCGSKAFYVRKAIATKNLKKLDDLEIPTLVDLEFVCAECGSCEHGIIQNEKFSKETEKTTK